MDKIIHSQMAGISRQIFLFCVFLLKVYIKDTLKLINNRQSDKYPTIQTSLVKAPVKCIVRKPH